MHEICRVCGETAGAYVHDQSASAADVHPFVMAGNATDSPSGAPVLAALPPSSGLSDERLAEIGRMNDRADGAQYGLRAVAIRDLLAEIARARSDAALGVAFRAALATVPGGQVSIDQWQGVPSAEGISVSGDTVRNDATRALASLLSRSSADRTKTDG
jgi:hypothetical protein